MRRRAVASAPLDVDLEFVDRRHHRPAVDSDLPDRELVPEVEADRRAHPFHRAVGDAGARPAAPLLGGLEEESQRARRRIPLEPAGGGERDRNVAVVAARVHAPGLLRRELLAARFRER